MKRHLAKKINNDTKSNNEQIEKSNIEATSVASKLLKNTDDLEVKDINQLGYNIAQVNGYDINQLIICDIAELNKRLILHKDDDIDQKPIFVICDNGKSHFITLCITKLLDQVVVLYKDFLNTEILESIRSALEEQFGKSIDIKINNKEAEEKLPDNSLISLRILQTMMENLKVEKKKEFINHFENPKKGFFAWVKDSAVSIKDWSFSLVKEGYYKTIAGDIDDLARIENAEFKKAFKKLINDIPLIEEVDNFKNYQILLKEFAETEENEIDNIDIIKIKKLEEAREKAFNKTRELKIAISQNEKGEQQLDIVKKFPTQMEKLTRIFEPLTRSKVDEKLDKILEEISIKLDIEYNKLKSFFKTQEEKKQNSNNSTPSIKNIEDVIDVLPKSKPKVASLKNTNKPFKQLLSEIKLEQSDFIQPLEEGYNKVKDFYELWENKDALAINKWAISKKGQLADSEIYEALAIMDRANELVTGGHRLRDTQILSTLTFLQQKDKGQLSQIQTGEGKTTIVSVLAAIKVLQGETVDVVTSNPVLASDGIRDKKLFYSLLNLSATTNNLDEKYKSGERECYKADIVYGSIGNFQFDYLKDSFLGLKTRAGRSFESIILDEVDSMIIDNASHIAKLSGPLPGMDSFKYIYIRIWQELHKAEEIIIQEFQKKLKAKAQELELQKLSDNEAQLLYKEFENELKDSIISRIKDHIKSTNPTKIDIIPSHIQEYADNSLDRWINSAIDAKFNYHEDEQYIIRINKDGEEVVQPVDYANTGITLKNTIWQYGLHQFLQLKHNLHLTSESLTSCFISNLGYINKYGDKIFGLTGTLGSEAEQELLSSIYNVHYAKIPTYKEKKFIEIDGEVIDDEIFSEKVADNAISEVEDNGRSSLIICETIKDAKAIQEILRRKNGDITIRTFFDEENSHITEEEINPGEVVIATNIAGRGTDFKTSDELEKNGGLQVCVAFLPCNKRVEDQAFGRTARQGNNGTAKLMIKKSEVEKLGINSNNFKEIKSVRDLKEEERIKQIKEVKILELKFQDILFEHFSSLYRRLKKEDKSEGEYQYALDDLKEFWAFWLEKKNFKGLELADKSPEEEFKDFESKAHKTIAGEIKFNPYYSIQQAEHFILNEKLDKAENALKHAIKISKNPEILHSAYIKLFEIAIEKGGILMDKFKKAVGDVFVIQAIEPDREYKENAKKYLRQAKEAFKKELDYIEHILGAEEFTNIIKSNNNREINKKDSSYWFSDEDMHTAGEKVLESLGINISVQFRNRLTKDQIETFCKEYQLQDQLPVFVCYNVGGKTNQNSGIHWVGMCVVKIQDRIKILYKDPKGDFENNMEVVAEEFKKHYHNLDFIPHTEIEQNDYSSCGPMTLENLRIMVRSIQKDGIEKFIENFASLSFSQQKSVLTFRNEFVDILPSESQKIANLFIKHIASKQQALSLNMGHVDSLIQQIDKHEGGISINSRISDYFSNLKPQNDNENKIKNTISNSELSELAALGTNTTYALREVHDVCPEIVRGAQIQIVGGIALLATGFCFPPALPVTSAIGGTMITEGLCDIAIELINKNSDGKFNKDAYVKGKIISYGLSILTMGISAAMQCPKILNAAKKACRWISETLRKCPFLKDACEFLATKFDQLGDWFEKMETIAKFSNMSKAEKLKYVDDLNKSKDLKQLKYLEENVKQIPALLKELQEVGKLTELTHFEKCISTLSQVAITTTKSVVIRTAENVIMNKVVTPALSSLMSELKPIIKEHVSKSVRENIDQEKLKSSTNEDVQNIIKEIRESINYETIKNIFKDAILGITKYCSNWRVQLCALAVGQYVSWKEVYNYAKDLCHKINCKIKSTVKSINHNVEELINQLIEQFSEEMYSQVVSTTIKTCKDVYSVGKSAYENYQKEKEEEATCLEINKDFKEGGQAGQEQAKALSDTIKRPICIYDEDGNKVIIGEQYKCLGDPIEVSYFPPDENNPNGHYVPYGKDKNWSLGSGENNCLFDAVGSQTGDNPSKLRQKTIHQMESDPTRYIAHHVHEVDGFDDIFMYGGKIVETKNKNKSYYDILLSDGTRLTLNKNIKKTEKEKLDKIKRLLNEAKDDKALMEAYRELLVYEEGIDNNYFCSNGVWTGRLGVNYETTKDVAELLKNEKIFNEKETKIFLELQKDLRDINKKYPTNSKDFVQNRKNDKEELLKKPEYYNLRTKIANLPEKTQNLLANKAIEEHLEKCKKDISNFDELPNTHKAVILSQKYVGNNYFALSSSKTGKPGYCNQPIQEGDAIKVMKIIHNSNPNDGKRTLGHLILLDPDSDEINNQLAGFDIYGKEKEIGWINRYFGKYTLGALSYILSLRINDLQIRNKNIRVLSGIFINQVENNVSDLIARIDESNEETVFVPLNLYNKHATGLIFEKLSEGGNQIIEVKYFDPLNKPIPEELKELIAISLSQEIVNFKQITVDEQNYANCGPEVIENFVLYLTGQRLSQEKAIELHSKLVENELIGKANYGTHLLFEETKVLHQLDNVAVINNLPTVIANTQFLLTNNINEELHINQNQIDELKNKHFVTPSSPITVGELDKNPQEIRNTNNSKDSEQILLVDSSKQPAIENYEEELHQDEEDVIKLDQIIPLEEPLASNFSNSIVVDNFINANENREELTFKSEIVDSGQKEIDLAIIEAEKIVEANFNIPLCGYSEEDERDIEIAKADELIYQGDYQRAFPLYKKYANEWQEDLGTIEDWLIDQQERGIVINKITKDTLSNDLATKLEEICNFYAEQIMNNKENLEQAQIAWANGFYMEAVNIYMTLCNQSDREMITKLDKFKKIIPERNNIPELNEPDNIYKVITQLEKAFILSSAIGLYENTDYYEHQNEFLAGDHIEYITVS